MFTRRVRRYAIALAIVVLLVAAYAAAGFLAVPHFLRSSLNSFVSTHYGRTLSIGDIRFNPFTFTLDVPGDGVRQWRRMSQGGRSQGCQWSSRVTRA